MREFIEIDKENNQINFIDNRYYYHAISDTYVPSVTTVLDAYPKGAGFYNWLKENGKNADAVRDAAGQKGSIVHNLTEIYDLGEEVSLLNGGEGLRYTQEEWSMFERYVDFRDNHTGFKVLEVELPLISPNLGYAGTLDRLFMLEDSESLMIVDIKTSNAIHDNYWLQQKAYVNLFEEAFNDKKINAVGILWLNAKTRTRGRGDAVQGKGWQLLTKKEDEFDSLEKTWKATKLLWEATNANSKPRNHTYKIKHKFKRQ